LDEERVVYIKKSLRKGKWKTPSSMLWRAKWWGNHVEKPFIRFMKSKVMGKSCWKALHQVHEGQSDGKIMLKSPSSGSWRAKWRENRGEKLFIGFMKGKMMGKSCWKALHRVH